MPTCDERPNLQRLAAVGAENASCNEDWGLIVIGVETLIEIALPLVATMAIVVTTTVKANANEEVDCDRRERHWRNE